VQQMRQVDQTTVQQVDQTMVQQVRQVDQTTLQQVDHTTVKQMGPSCWRKK